jgi:signal transduction histidine kinase
MNNTYLLGSLVVVLISIIAYLLILYSRMKKSWQNALQVLKVIQEKYVQAQANYPVSQVNELIDRYENEIQKMGADIHDDLIQKLAVYRLYVNKLERAEDLMAVHVLIKQMKEDFEAIVRSVRKISRRLMPEQEIGSFTSMMQELCKRMETPGVIFIHFETSGNEIAIRHEHRQHLLRIVQEAITNVTKHTPAWHVYVRLIFSDKTLQLEIEDDGQKFETLINKIKDKNALSTLRMRINKIGGAIEFRKGNVGTIATVTYTLATSQESNNAVSESVGN